MAKKRAKQVQEIINTLNGYLKYNKVIDEYDNVKEGLTWLLLATNLYYGYNYFYDKEVNGKMYQCLANTTDKEKLKKLKAYIQLY